MMSLTISAAAMFAMAASMIQADDAVYAVREITGPAITVSEDLSPQLLRAVPPSYSSFARCDTGSSHSVKMAFDVFPDGKTANIRVLTATDECFIRAAVRAMEHWKFLPAEADGVAITTTGVEQSIAFHSE